MSWFELGVCLILATCLCVGWPSAARAETQAPAREPSVSYRLHARLKEVTQGRYVIEGAGTITLDNTTSSAVESLELHLYMNAFAQGSMALSSPFLNSRSAINIRAEEHGGITIHSFTDTRDGASLAVTFPTPEGDRTTANARLTQPIAPGTRVSFDMNFTTALPALRERSGSADSFVFAGQWFPKLAKLEPDGSWVQFVFHPQAEFYANFGTYDVTLDTPEPYVVGASGTLAEVNSEGGRRLARYVATSVHDFAWTAWPEFQSHEFSVGDVRVTLLFPPHHELNRDVTVEAVTKVLPWLERWLGAYTLPSLTIVHPPPFAGAAGGMEYPGLITTGGTRLRSLVTDGMERVVIHELVHQWFYGQLASNEYAWPFLDEGLTLYAENRAIRELYTGTKAVVLRFGTELGQYLSATDATHQAPIAQAANSFTSFSQIAALAYDRAALVFETFERVYPTFPRAIGEYARTYAGRHPTPTDLFALTERHLGRDAVVNMRRALFERGWVNYRVGSVEHRPDPTDPKGVLNRVLLIRQGALHFPVPVVLTDESGHSYRHVWSDAASPFELVLPTPSPIVTACIDPERTVTLDSDPSDNCHTVRPPSPPPHWVTLLLALQSVIATSSW